MDLYGGEAAQTPERARELMMQAMQAPEATEANLRAAAEYLQRAGSPRLGVIGWCFGGGWSLRTALAMPGAIDAAVVYYGQPITEADRLEKLDAPLLGLFGGADQGIPVEKVREMEAKLRELGKDATIVVYPGAGHAFANPSGTTYDPAVAAEAWERTRDFLARQLKGTA